MANLLSSNYTHLWHLEEMLQSGNLGKHSLWVVCEPQESDQPASFGEEVFLHDSPQQVLCKDGTKLQATVCVTPIVKKEHPKSHKVLFMLTTGHYLLSFFIQQQELDKEGSKTYQGTRQFNFLWRKANNGLKASTCFEGSSMPAHCDEQKDYFIELHYEAIHLKHHLWELQSAAKMIEIKDVSSTMWAWWWDILAKRSISPT